MKVNKNTLLILAVIIALGVCHGGHSCQHDNYHAEGFDQSQFPTMDVAFSNEQNLRRNLQVKTDRPFKITYDMSFFNTNLKTSDSEAKFKSKVDQVMKVAQIYFSNLLKMIPRPAGSMKWTLERNICGAGNMLAKIPANDRTEDKDSDLHLYLVFMNEPSSEYVAYAAACRELAGSGATHGQITFNQGWFNRQTDLDSHKTFQDIQGTVFHEIIHVLGFQETSYKNWVDPTSKQPYASVITTSTARNQSVKFISTPNVKKAAQDYYGCKTLPGMPLENQGSAASAGSHWEATLMVDEMMKSTFIKTNVYLSPFTIALLKDTGYYSQVNDSMADDYFYGKGQGCDFVLGTCDAKKNREFCDQSTEAPKNQCDYYATGVSTCETGKFFDDKCLQRVVMDKGKCFDYKSNTNGSAKYTQNYGQYFGEDSKCFMSTLIHKMEGKTYDLTGACYKFECDMSTKSLKVFAGAEFKICKQAGEELKFKDFEGYIKCPQNIDQFCSFKRFCPKYCSSNGYCMKGKCICSNGSTKPDCA